MSVKQACSRLFFFLKKWPLDFSGSPERPTSVLKAVFVVVVVVDVVVAAKTHGRHAEDTRKTRGGRHEEGMRKTRQDV